MTLLFQIIRFGDNFNWRCNIGIQSPVFIRIYPEKLKKQRNPRKWKFMWFPKEY